MNNPLIGFRVLVVEDEVFVSWVVEDILSELGCVVVGPVAHLDEALAAVELQDFDCGLLDLNLNGRKSYPVADALIARGVPLILSTGYNKDGLPECYQAVPFLQKPYSQLQLSSTLLPLSLPKALLVSSPLC